MMRYLLLAVVVSVALFAGLAGWQSPATAAASGVANEAVVEAAGPGLDATSNAPLFGIVVQGELMDPALRQRVLDAGAKWTRAEVKWNEVEPTQGTRDWSALDTYLGEIQQAGLIPIVFVAQNPSWAATTTCGPLTSTATFASLIGAAAERYDGDTDYDGDGIYGDGPVLTKVDYWEPYQEPDNKYAEYSDFKGCWGQSVVSYTQLLSVAWSAVHTANPDAQLGIGGLADESVPTCTFPSCTGQPIFNTGFMDQVLAYIAGHNTGRYFDFVDFHSYPAFAYIWDPTYPYNNGLYAKAQTFRSKLDNAGMTDRYIVSTEAGRPSSSTKNYWNEPGYDGNEWQARAVVTLFAQGMRAGLRSMDWYSLLDYDSALYGLISDTGPRPSYYAYQTLTQQLGNASFVTKLTTSPGAEVYVFNVPGIGTRSVVWETNSYSPTVDVAVRFLGTTLYTRDKFGTQKVYHDGQPGDLDSLTNSVTISVTRSPIYVEGRPDVAPAACTYQRPLANGWNLISLPCAPANVLVTETLRSINGSYNLVQAYDAFDTAAPWKTYDTGRPAKYNTLKSINESMGLWVNVTSTVSVTLSITGTMPISLSIPMTVGWNLVGYPSWVTRPVTVALSNITGSYNLAQAYDAFDTTAPWKTYDTTRPAKYNTLKVMAPGVGYWINMTEARTWQVP
jgi:hypothetical protein